jgi:hypothetical protein
VAIGFAIEAYEWGQVGEEPADVRETYEMVDVENINLIRENDTTDLQPVFGDLDTGTFTGSFTFTDDGEGDE